MKDGVRHGTTAIAFALMSTLLPVLCRAACDLIPQAQQAFRAPLGTVNRPFASPGDAIEIDVRQTLCDGASRGLQAAPEDHVVTVFFQRPSGGPRRAVVVTTADCSSSAMLTKRNACARILGDTSPTPCQQVNLPGEPTNIALVDRRGRPHLSFRFPDAAAAPPAGYGIELTGPVTIGVTTPADSLPCTLATTPCRDHPGLIACVDELFDVDGTCSSTPDAVFPSFTALPRPNDYEHLCFADEPCDAAAPAIRLALDGNGNLLIPMSWRAVLANQPGAIFPRLLRATVKTPVPLVIPSPVFLHSFTPDGASLPPIFEPKIDASSSDPFLLTLFGSTDAPSSVLRIALERGTCAAGPHAGSPCATTRDCDGDDCTEACTGGPNDGVLCTQHADCPNGRCGELYDAGVLLAAGSSGAALALNRQPASGQDGICQLDPNPTCSADSECAGTLNECVTYAFQATTPVALETLTSGSPELLPLTVRESVVGKDLTGDCDLDDTVAQIQDRPTGRTMPLDAPDGFATDGTPLPACAMPVGAQPSCDATPGTPQGRAVLLVNRPPFKLPAFDTEGDVTAFLESEIGENYCDLNGDHDRTDAILRVFDLSGELTQSVSPPRAVDGAAEINGQAVVVSIARVFFRSSESAMARQRIVPVSVRPDGKTGDQGSGDFDYSARVSGDGSCVAFHSLATDLRSPLADTNGWLDVYVRDLVAGTTELISVTPAGQPGNHESSEPAVSADCRYIAFISRASDLPDAPDTDTNGFIDIYLRDRCVSRGSAIPGCTARTDRMSVPANFPSGPESNGSSNARPALSDDGRFVAFLSNASNLLAAPQVDSNPGGNQADVFVRDRCVSNGLPVPGCTPTTELVSVATDGTQGNGPSGSSRGPSISGDGRYVAFVTDATNLGAVERPGFSPGGHLYVRDREMLTTKHFDLTAAGETGRGGACPMLTPDGRYVAFSSFSNDLTTESDVVSTPDKFVRDLLLGLNQAVSVPTGGGRLLGLGENCLGGVSADGRYVVFDNETFDDLPGPTAPISTAFIHDRATRTTDRLLIGSGGNGARTNAGGISSDGRVIAFTSAAADLLPPGDDVNGSETDVFVRLYDMGDPLDVDQLLFEDGALDDTVLEVLNTAGPSPGVVTLCPATQTAVAKGKAVFLRPEAPPPGTTNCPGGSLNLPDTDTDDLVVQFWPGTGPVENLGVAATAVAMSPTSIAALVSEAGEGADANGDSDTLDTVVKVHPVGAGAWTNVGQAADVVQVCGALVVFLTPEASQGTDLNDDSDQSDRVLQLYDTAQGPGGVLVNTGQAAEDFVCGPSFIAFRTSEASQGNTNLNGDADSLDYVLQTYDRACVGPPAGCVQSTDTSVRPCLFEACDPRTPYRVVGHTVKFLTYECDEAGSALTGCMSGGADLNSNGQADLILQVFDFDTREVHAVTAVPQDIHPTTGVPVDAPGDPLGDGGPDPSDGETGGTDTVLAGSGRCFENLATTCANDAECSAGQICNGTNCAIDHRACERDEDCPADITCDLDGRSTPASPDSDGDGIPDHVDNCPFRENTDQTDGDGDGVGDDCDGATCGNGTLEPGEACEDGHTAACPVRCVACQCTGCPNVVTDPNVKVVVKAARDAGKLKATMVIDTSYDGSDPVTVRLSDGDVAVIAEQHVGPLLAEKRPGSWRYKTRAPGLQSIRLKSLATPGKMKLTVKAKRWFTSAAANQGAANTSLTVTVGSSCFTHAATRKTD